MIPGITGSSQYVVPLSGTYYSSAPGGSDGIYAPMFDGVDKWYLFARGQGDVMVSSPHPNSFVDGSNSGWATTGSTGAKTAVENGWMIVTNNTGLSMGPVPLTGAGASGNSSLSGPFNDAIYFKSAWYAFGDAGRWARTTTMPSGWVSQTVFSGASDIYCVATDGNTMVVGCAAGKIFYTTNGTAWTQVTTSSFGTSNVQRLVYANGYWVAAGQAGTCGWSTTGTSGWAQVTTGSTSDGGLLTFHMGRWVVIGAGTETPKVSADGTPNSTWSASNATAVSGGRSNRKASSNAYISWVGSTGTIFYGR